MRHERGSRIARKVSRSVHEKTRREAGIHVVLHQSVRRSAQGRARGQRPDRRRGFHPKQFLRYRRCCWNRARIGRADCARCRQKIIRRSRTRHCELRDQGARREIENRRFDRRHVYDLKRWRLRLALEHAHFESAPKRNSRYAQNYAAPDRGRREGGSAPDDVSRTQLRSSRD